MAENEGMAIFDIWTEGYNDMGNTAPAKRHTDAPIEAATFDEAVAKYVESLPSEPTVPYQPPFKDYWHRSPDGSWTVWGCSAFPDEESARKSFG